MLARVRVPVALVEVVLTVDSRVSQRTLASQASGLGKVAAGGPVLAGVAPAVVQ